MGKDVPEEVKKAYSAMPCGVMLCAGKNILYMNAAMNSIAFQGFAECFFLSLEREGSLCAEKAGFLFSFANNTYNVRKTAEAWGDVYVFILEKVPEKLSTRFSTLLRGPLSMLFMASEKMTCDIDGESLERCVSVIRHNNQKLLRTLNHLSFLEEPKFYFDEFDIVSFLQSSTDIASDISESAGVPISFRCDAEHFMVRGDRKLLETMYFNLLTNAICYTRDGNKISVRLYIGRQLRLVVSDSGAGIRCERLDGVMDASEDDIGSCGLGMLLVRKIAAGHGGTVLLESREKEGTSVTVTFSAQPDKGEPNMLSLQSPHDDFGDGYRLAYLELSVALGSSSYARLS